MKKLVFFCALFITGTAIANAQSSALTPSGVIDNTHGTSTGLVQITVYPNPVVDVVNVHFDGPVKEPIIETFNVNGQKVLTPVTGTSDGSNKTEIDLGQSPPGIYVIRVSTGKEVIHVQKIIKN